jgi:hypothetical protein
VPVDWETDSEVVGAAVVGAGGSVRPVEAVEAVALGAVADAAVVAGAGAAAAAHLKRTAHHRAPAVFYGGTTDIRTGFADACAPSPHQAIGSARGRHSHRA